MRIFKIECLSVVSVCVVNVKMSVCVHERVWAHREAGTAPAPPLSFPSAPSPTSTEAIKCM